MSCQFQTVHERQILFRDQDVDPPLTCASLVPGFQTMPGLKNAKPQIAKQIARELTEPRTVGIFRQQESSFYQVSHNPESQDLQDVMEERLRQLGCGGTDKHSPRPTSAARQRRVPKQAM